MEPDDRARPGPRHKLSVRTGLHAGTSVALNEESLQIGRSMEADIILLDSGIAPVHARLSCVDDSLTLEAVEAGLSVDETFLEVGETTVTTFPAHLRLGDADLIIEGPSPLPPAIVVDMPAMRRGDPSAERWLPLGVIGALALTGAGVIAYALVDGFSDLRVRQPATAVMPAPSAPAVSASASPALAERERAPSSPRADGRSAIMEADKPGVSDEDPARVLETLLAASPKLALTVVPSPEHLVVTGQIEAADHPKWQAVQQRFDEVARGRVLLVDKVEVVQKLAAPTISFEAVWVGPDPHVIVGGKRQHPGDVINGWQIDQITRDRIVVRQGHRSVALSY